MTSHQRPCSQLQGWQLKPPFHLNPLLDARDLLPPASMNPFQVEQDHTELPPSVNRLFYLTHCKLLPLSQPNVSIHHLLAIWCTPADEIACPVYDQDSGDTLEYHQLWHHPKYRDIWEASYTNELGRLCQGVGTGTKGIKKQRVEGTDTYRLIKFSDIPPARRKEICFSRVCHKQSTILDMVMAILTPS